MQRGYPFHVLTALIFTLVMLLIGGGIGTLAYDHQRQVSIAATGNAFSRSVRESQSELATEYIPVQTQIALLALALPATAPLDRQLAALAQLLENSPAVSSVSIRDPSTYISLAPLPHAAARQRAAAPPQAAYRLDLAAHGTGTARFFDARLRPIGNPRARAENFPPMEISGLPVRYAVAEGDGARVIQANLELRNLSAILSQLRATPSTQLAMLDQSGRLLASSQGSRPPMMGTSPASTLRGMELPILAAVADQPVRSRMVPLEVDGVLWQALAQASEIAPGLSVFMVMAAPQDEILAEAHRLLHNTLWAILCGLALIIPLIWWSSRLITDSLRRLAEAAAHMRDFRFATRLPRSSIRELDVIAQAMQQMQDTLQRFLDISARLAAERHYDRLLEEIVAETMAAADANAGVVYLFEADRHLRPMSWKKSDGAAPLPPEPVAPRRCQPFDAALSEDFPLQITLAPAHLDPELAWLNAWLPGQTIDVLLVPLRNRSRETLGLLLLARGTAAGHYDRNLVAFIHALSGTMAITIEKQGLLANRKTLLDGVIRMIAGAIDARSPYTSGHCQRVPELVAMLAEAATTDPASPYRHAPFDEHARETLHLAAWLHDCGKLFVPDYVTDKSVKLEAIHNRIHEIRMRFEVLKRDAEISYWRGLTEGKDAERLQRGLDEARQALDADYTFVAACNLGDRTLSEEDIARLVRIGSRAWLRTLDDRIGISDFERQCKASVPPRTLPASEHLLADRLEHLQGDQATGNMYDKQELPGHMPRPRHRLNLGELYCLSVKNGTLTPEERYLIKAHVLGTISMLSALPFPPELAQVPETAGSHHEHLDGSGYPYGKRAADLSLGARIIAIADVFEALTAPDRPYKPGKTPDEALAIMADMARRKHLDPDLFDLFVRNGIAVRYAAAYPSCAGTAASAG